MDRRLEICDWFRKMGYDGDFPENLDRVCNNSTSFIWDQLIENTKPKAEVETIKHNILAVRLANSNLKKDGDIRYPLKEIKLYLRKKELEKELENINYSISEKHKTNLQLQQENRIKRFSVEKTHLKIKENEEREFILKENCKILESDTKCADHIIELQINTTTNEQEDSNDITHTLNDYVETLQKNIKQLPLSIRSTPNKTINGLMHSTQKTGRKRNVFQNYLRSTEIQTARKLSTKKNIGLYTANKSVNVPNRVNVCLFSDENNSITPNIPKINICNTRDSIELGIQFDDDDDNENFLVNVSKAQPLNYKLDLPQNSTRKKMDSSYLFKRNKNVSINQETNESMIKKMFNESLYNEIEDLLCHHIRQNVWNAFQERDDKLHFNISKKINFWPLKCFSTQKGGVKDIAKLQAIHIQTEFKIIKNNLILKQLTEKLNEKKKNFKMTLINSGYPNDIIDILQRKILLYIEDIGMDFTIESMKRKINIQNTEEVTAESDIRKKLIEIKNNISLKKNSIIEYLEIIQDIFYSINHTRSVTSSCVRKLAQYTSDLEWCSLLKETVNTNEIAVFEEFPLEYNRRCINTDSSVYYKDIHSDKFLCNREIDNENLILLSKILESPFSAPETILLDILRAKRKLEVLKSIKCTENDDYKKYSLVDLQTQETYIENILDRFKALIKSSLSKKTLSSSSLAKTIMEIWTEVPFKEFISPNRTLDDKDYKHYEKLFDFYNNF